MALDPRIPLSVEAPKIGGGSALKDALDIQEARQKAQANALILKEKMDQDATNRMLDEAYKRYVKPDGTIDTAGLAYEVAGAGKGHLAPGIIEAGAKLQDTIAKATKAKAEAEQSQKDLAGGIGASMQDLLDKGAHDEDVAGYGVAHIAALRKKGLIDDAEAAGITRNLDPSNPDQLRRTIGAMRESSKEQDQAITSRMSAETGQKAEKRLQGEATIREPLIRAQTEEAQARIPEIKAQGEKAAAEAKQIKDLGDITGPNVSGIPDVAPGQKNEAFLQTLAPGIQSQVKMLAEGRLAIPSASALRAPYWQGLLQATAKYDPTFDAVNYNARNKTRAAFTAGKEAANINALNTVIGHLGKLSQAADDLGNFHEGSLGPATTLGNKIGNIVSRATGSSKVTNFNTTQKAVSDEVTRVWRQMGGSEKDVEAARDNLNASGTPEQLHGAIATYADLLESKLASLNEQYRQGMGTDKIDILRPDTRAVLDKLEAKAKRSPGSLTANLPGGEQSAAPDSKPAIGTRKTVNGVSLEWQRRGTQEGWVKAGG